MKKRKRSIIWLFIFIILLIVGICSFVILVPHSKELKSIKSEKELMKIYKGDSDLDNIFIRLSTLPFSMLEYLNRPVYYGSAIDSEANSTIGIDSIRTDINSTSSANTQKDYSKTNIQVENVDEADITKTDGDYIYSISENSVVITNVKDPQNIKIEKKIVENDDSYPQDLMLYNDKLIVISSISDSEYGYKNNTIVRVYDIKEKSNPKKLKEYELFEEYYTSRCIENNLYVISSGSLRKEETNNNDEKIVTYYIEDNTKKEIPLGDIKYLDNVSRDKQTLISKLDLENTGKDITLAPYLIDISNAYVSEKSIYLANDTYDEEKIPLIKLFTLKGVFGVFDWYENLDYDRGMKTEIHKFDIQEDGKLKYNGNAKTEGRVINQYSFDEKNSHLRVALYNDDGSRIEIFDENLKLIGTSEKVAKGEKMYSSRFIGDKVYFVTYKTVDPLFVVDLKDETSPKVLGKLKIPGYSTYLHPYDENHLIGIGMETKETVNRNSQGKVISTRAQIIGMKMALFDISDVNNPKQISSTVIGDRRTTSAILTNPKALLFSKEKSLIAIPVNNYNEDFEIKDSSETYSSLINSYKNYNKKRIAEGYMVYDISVENGLKLKGIITHEISDEEKNTGYSYSNTSKLLRGMYIEDKLYTVSENQIKVNELKDLKQIADLKIK